MNLQYLSPLPSNTLYSTDVFPVYPLRGRSNYVLNCGNSFNEAVLMLCLEVRLQKAVQEESFSSIHTSIEISKDSQSNQVAYCSYKAQQVVSILIPLLNVCMCIYTHKYFCMHTDAQTQKLQSPYNFCTCNYNLTFKIRQDPLHSYQSKASATQKSGCCSAGKLNQPLRFYLIPLQIY